MAKITFKDKYLHEGLLSGRRTEIVVLPDGKMYAIIDPDNVYRVGQIQSPNDFYDDYQATAYKVSNQRRISKIYGALEKAILPKEE